MGESLDVPEAEEPATPKNTIRKPWEAPVIEGVSLGCELTAYAGGELLN